MFQEMFIYEIILLVLGVALFIVLLAGLVLYIYRKQPINQTYLAAFLLPILMIAYPSVTRFSFLNNLVVLERTTKQLEENPEDEEVREELKKYVEEVEQRPIETPEHLAQVAEAKYWLERYDEAEKYIEKAQEIAPESEAVQKVQKLIQDPASKKRPNKNGKVFPSTKRELDPTDD
ncbi:MAG: hypothetical protein AAFU60_05985 [Bacteroidota bacterium]